MNFLGMGTMEFLIIMLVAFIFLGPERMVDAARFMGKAVRSARRMTSELSQSMLAEVEPGSAADPFDRSGRQQSGGGTSRHPQPGGPADGTGPDRGPEEASQSTSTGPHQPLSHESSADEDAPVPFDPGGKALSQEAADTGPSQDQG